MMSHDPVQPPSAPPEASAGAAGDAPVEGMSDEAQAGVVSVPPPVVMTPCWRCGLQVPEAAACFYCGATPRGTAAVAPPTSVRNPVHPPPRVLGVILAYTLFLSTSLIWGVILHSNKDASHDFVDTGVAVVEFVDFLFTLILFLWLGRFHVRKPRVWVRVVTWLVATPVAVGLYFLSDWYVTTLRGFIDVHWLYVEEHWKFTPFYVITVAVQPAVVEELFFRYFAFGALRQVTNTHSAVFLSAMMFSLAHLYNPLGLPFLFVIGVALGYARAYSGGLVLPMLMHFGHNLTILWLESVQ
jgi:membrane protease YdiL (CAAX protease family)